MTSQSDEHDILQECLTRGKTRVDKRKEAAVDLENRGLVKLSRGVAKLTAAGEFAASSLI